MARLQLPDGMTVEEAAGGDGPRRSKRERKQIEPLHKVEDTGENSDNYDDSDDSDGDGDDDDDDAETEQDEEAEKEKETLKKKRARRQKKATPKKAGSRKDMATSDASEHEDDDDEGDDDDESLFKIVRRGRVAFRTWIEDWVTQYQDNTDQPMLELLTLFVQACGCEGHVTQGMYDTSATDIVKSVQALKETMRNETYPIAKGASSKKLRENLASFLTKLIMAVKDEILYDGVFFDAINTWLSALSTSQVRAFRHTCTFLALKINTALLQLYAALLVDLDKVQRQMDGKATASAKLKQRVDKIKRNLKEVESYATSIFNSVFVHRYKDIYSGIRVDCLTELGVWFTSKRSFFVDDFNPKIKYLGWMLNDSSIEVRKAALLSLKSVYAKEELHGHLELLTSRFKGRLVEMTNDVDLSVATEALRIMVHLIDFDDALSEDDQTIIFKHLLSENEEMRRAAGTYVYQQVWTNEIMAEMAESQKEAKENDTEFNEKRTALVGMVDFCLEVVSPRDEDTFFFVDALWDKISIFHDWKSMTDLLKESAGDSDVSSHLTDQQEVALASIMSSAVLRAGETAKPKPCGKQTQGKKAAAVEDRENAATEITLHFAEELPVLLRRFANDNSIIARLVLIAKQFDLTLIVQEKLQDTLDELLVELSSLFFKHTSEDLFESIAGVFKEFLDCEGSVARKVRSAWKRVGERLCENLQLGLETGPTVTGAQSTDAGSNDHVQPNVALLINMQRLLALMQVLDPTQYLTDDVATMLIQLFEDGAHGDVPPSILEVLIKSMYMQQLWKCKEITQGFCNGNAVPSKSKKADANMEDDDEEKKDENDDLPSEADIEECALGLNKMIESFRRIFTTTENIKIQSMSFVALTDLLVLANPNAEAVDKRLAPMAYTVGDELGASLAEYVETCLNAPAPEDSAEKDGDDDDGMRLTMEDKKKVLLDAAKLFAYNVVHSKHSMRILTFFDRLPELSDVYKIMLQKLRKHDPMGLVDAVLDALIALYERAVLQGQDIYHGPIQLAKKLVPTFGVNTTNDDLRQAMMRIHLSGIKYALRVDSDDDEVNRVSFLDVLREFSFKLHKVDAEQVCEVLEQEKSDLDFGDADEEILASLTSFSENLERIRDGRVATKGPVKTGEKQKAKVGSKAAGRSKTAKAKAAVGSKKRRAAKKTKVAVLPVKRPRHVGKQTFAWGAKAKPDIRSEADDGDESDRDEEDEDSDHEGEDSDHEGDQEEAETGLGVGEPAPKRHDSKKRRHMSDDDDEDDENAGTNDIGMAEDARDEEESQDLAPPPPRRTKRKRL